MSPDRPVGDLFRRFRERLSAERENGSAAGRESRSAAGRESGSRATAAGPGVGRTDAGSRDAGLAPHPPRDAAPRRRRGKGGKGGGEQLNVPPAEFTSYYGRPILKPPVWRWDIAAYLFTGGLAAGSSLLAAGGQFTGRPALRRAGRVAALAGVGASTYFLVNDLGRPSRFHHMLRVAKVTSPMSVGTWILSVFGPAAGVAAVAEAAPLLPGRGVLGLGRRLLPPAGHAAGVVAAVTAPALATYTGVLLADTAVPSWHEAYPELPAIFAGSALASGAGVGLVAAPCAQAGPARRMAVAGAAMELWGSHRVENRLGLLSEPYTQGTPGKLLRAGRALTAAGVAGALIGRRSRVLSALSGGALIAASACTRFGIFHGGVASARDPRYTVVPQRERADRRAADQD
ncbi:polysulfide reductase NrfD [Micromonospora tulbaghiae]|uniref:Polysulfide reductase NrfD n=1 Tax=Micromonospora tulbaghiae TaxID=479978 RepID=A0AAW4JSS9_9ACTN|nr:MULTISPECIES: NrfD/PsrC family molybdoenzyme membrane anchor subunit [Micromonospora]KAB1904987.1 nitrite reductase [Micromonospora sp. AMSO1212t]MBO4141839.1 polysulfide reductase NrfD [Micromonospora tulbaghiae]MDX5458943.1 polysulfide reductase NrfD [Micromonospora tulbaghiae]SCF09477.1 Polysulphide reductase, NrfD [Micromonospora tulbaghiae]